MTLKVTQSNRFDLVEMLDWLYNFAIAFLPILYIIKVPGLNMSLGTVILIAYIPRSILYIFTRIQKKSRVKVFVFFIFYVYLIARSDGNVSRIILCCASFLLLYGHMKEQLRLRKLEVLLRYLQ